MEKPMKTYSIFLLLLIPLVVHSGECEKNTAREAVVCLEDKILSLSKNLDELRGQVQGAQKNVKGQKNNQIEIVPIPGIPDPTISSTATSNSIEFNVVTCNHHKLGAECEIMITSNRDDTDIFIYPTSRAYDEYGNEFKIGNISIANSSSNLENEKYVTHRFIEGVPVKSKIILAGLSKESTRITALDIRGYRDHTYSNDKYRVNAKLRNIVILP